MLRSVVAVLAGFLFIFLLASGADMLLRSMAPGAFGASGRVDSTPMLLLTIAYVFVFATAGCWLTARLAPAHPMRHALILGLLGLAFNIAGTIAMWDTAPAWFHLVSLALVMPAAWLGGRLRELQLERRPAGTPRTA